MSAWDETNTTVKNKKQLTHTHILCRSELYWLHPFPYLERPNKLFAVLILSGISQVSGWGLITDKRGSQRPIPKTYALCAENPFCREAYLHQETVK